MSIDRVSTKILEDIQNVLSISLTISIFNLFLLKKYIIRKLKWKNIFKTSRKNFLQLD